MGGMSVADINELAAQQEYNSLFNDLGVNFFDKEFYGPSAASNLLKEVTDEAARAEVSSITKARVEAAKDALNLAQNPLDGSEPSRMNENEASVTADAIQYSIQLELTPLIQSAIDMYGTTGIFDHQPTLDLIKKTLGEDYLQQQLELIQGTENTLDSTDTLSDREENLGSAEAIRTGMGEAEARTQAGIIEQETTQTQTPDPETEETTLPPEETDFTPIPRPEGKSIFGVSTDALNATTRAWDRKYEGKLDPVTGEKIMVDPRPEAGGPKDKEVEARTSSGMRLPGKTKKVTAREEWDILYGDTHNPDGSPNL